MPITLDTETRVQRITEAIRTLGDTTPPPLTSRVSIIDRVALRAGVVLVLWGSRRRQRLTPLTHETHGLLRQTERAREERARRALRTAPLAPFVR